MKLPLRSVLCCAFALVSFFAFASSASATNFCVGAGTDCDQSFDFDADGVYAAIAAYDASDPDDDVISIAPGTIEFTNTVDPEEGAGILHIVGAGSGKTKLVFNEVAGMNLHLDFGEDSGVSGLTVEAAGETPDNRTGLALHGGTAEDVYVLMAPGGNRAFSFAGGTQCLDCRAKVSGPAIGFHVDPGLAVITDGKAEVYDPDASVHARGVSLESSASQAVVSRTKLLKFNRGVFGYLGTLSVKDSLIDLGDQDGALGLEVDAQGNVDDDPESTLDGVTIVGSGDNQRGITVRANATGTGSVTSTFANSLSYLTGTDSVDVSCDHAQVVPLAVTIRYSMAEEISANGSCSPSVSNLTTGTPLFLDANAGDYRPAPGSPVIDAGDPLSGDAGRKDLWGGVRYMNGSDFNFAGNIDLGAGEYQNYAPNKPQASASPTTVFAGSPVTFSAAGTDPNGQALSFSWEFGEGGGASGASVTRTYASPGSYKAKAIASDGSRSTASAWVEVTVVATPQVLPPIPSFSFAKPKCSFKSNKKAKNGFTASTKKPKGCFLQGSSTRQNSYMFRLERTAAGYLVGGTCKAKQGKSGKAKRCNLPLKGTQTLNLPGAISFLSFGGRWNNKTLAPGSYKVLVSNPGNPTAKPVTIGISVAKQGSTGRTKDAR